MASAKGGSGKTVLTATFASFLSALGKRVLIIDTDASTNGLTLMYLKEVRVNGEIVLATGIRPIGSFETGINTKTPSIVKLQNGVDFIPATYSFKNTETIEIKSFRSGLISVLNIYYDEYDFIFLDAQAGSDLYAHIAMERGISDEVVIVSEYDPLSAAGIERLKGLFREDLTYERTWVLLNKMLPDFIQSFNDFLEVAKYLSPIPWDSEVVRAYARRKLALDMEYANEFTLAIMQTLKSLLGDSIKKDIENWLQTKEMAIKQPIERQYLDTKMQLQNLLKLKYNQARKNFVYDLTTGISAIVVISIFIYFIFSNTELSKDFTLGKVDLLIPLTTGVIISIFLSQKRFRFTKESIKNDSYKKEIEILEQKIEKLESLRNANLELLIKHKI